MGSRNLQYEENLKPYWIPDGFRAVLMPKQDFHIAHQHHQQQESVSN
ncbi:10448_t:CDS:2 [Ambispora leptoticha]|uniref:10448_t:CDS:1 n=1 Tax=Ambispora leptoticha TaxID=144679 RepID=A0A9N8ZN45_9GLOM|nr:10448_t:CDS:2 [Ambispora leptoticha]